MDRVVLRHSITFYIVHAIFGVLTVGLLPLALLASRGRMLKSFDDTHLETYSGLRIPWSELSSVTWRKLGFNKSLIFTFGGTEIHFPPMIRDRRQMLTRLGEVTHRQLT